MLDFVLGDSLERLVLRGLVCLRGLLLRGEIYIRISYLLPTFDTLELERLALNAWVALNSA